MIPSGLSLRGQREHDRSQGQRFVTTRRIVRFQIYQCTSRPPAAIKIPPVARANPNFQKNCFLVIRVIELMTSAASSKSSYDAAGVRNVVTSLRSVTPRRWLQLRAALETPSGASRKVEG